jgi:YVTN family beta-propeller protein
VSVISVASGTVTSTIPVGPGPFGVAFTPDGSKAYVTNGYTVSVITVASGTVTSTIPVGKSPVGVAFGVAFTPDGSTAYVTTYGSGTVSVITVASGTVTSTIPVGPDPHGVAFTSDGSTAYVTNTGANTVSGSNTVSVINVDPAAVTANVTGSFSEAMDSSTLTPATFTLKAGTTTVPAAVTYNSTDKVATLNPDADLAAGTTYTATIKGGSSGVKDVAGNALATDKTWTFTTASAGDTTAPTVTGTSPAAGATGVAVTANVTGSFSEAMDTSRVTSDTFTLKTGATTVAAAVTYNSTDRVATLNPDSDLAPGTTYTATISTGAKDVAGNALASDKTWTFTTAPAGGGTSETVTLTATADSYVSSGAATTNNGTSTLLGVDSSPVEATYVKFDLSAYEGRTLESATLQLHSAGSGSTGTQNVKLVATDSWTETGITYSNRPTPGSSIGTLGPTAKNTSYSVPLTVSGLTGELGQQLSLGMDSSNSDGLDLNSKEAGSTLAPKLVLTLSGGGGGGGDTTAPTVTVTSPAADATGVAVTANVTGSFSEAMDTSTLTPATFTLKAGATTGTAAVNSTGNVATLNPGADLAPGTTYTATISTGVKDVAGNALASDKTWTFTTATAGGGTSETVTLTATADSYVSSGAATTNNGTSTLLGVDSSPVEATYFKFDLSAYAGRTLESATLQLHSAGSGSTGTQNVKLVANDLWTETGITYSNRPALGTSIGTLGPTAKNTSYSVPLTVSGLTGELGQQLSLAMDANSSDGLDLNSKEAGSTAAPKLVLTLKN